jgi:hypothetical protein
MKYVLLIFSFIVILLSCQKKAVPVISERKVELPKLTSFDYPPRETVAPDTLAGKRIYANRCRNCHDLPLPQQFNIKRWDEILPDMFVRARLNNEEGLHVRTWIMVHAAR